MQKITYAYVNRMPIHQKKSKGVVYFRILHNPILPLPFAALFSNEYNFFFGQKPRTILTKFFFLKKKTFSVYFQCKNAYYINLL
jgi:hypothetical protein